MSDPDNSHTLQRWVHWTLLCGLILSALLLVAGLVVVLVRNEDRPLTPPPSPGALLHGVLRGNGIDMLYLGLIVLMATPVMRVAVLAVGWALIREWRFAAVALAVLALLGLGLALGVG